MQVKATQLGFYGELKRPGTIFTIESEKEFSSKWMEEVPKAKAAPKAKAE